MADTPGKANVYHGRRNSTEYIIQDGFSGWANLLAEILMLPPAKYTQIEITQHKKYVREKYLYLADCYLRSV